MKIVGEARGLARPDDDVLVGVAPRGRVREPEEEPKPHEEQKSDERRKKTELEPHHTHFVLADSAEWGGETDLLFRVAESLSNGARAAVVLLSGGGIARQEVLEAVRRGWPVVVIRGFGGFS